MHNFVLANAQAPENVYSNTLTLENCVNAAMYNYWVPAKDLELQAAAFVPTYYTANRTWTGEPAHWELAKVGGNVTLNYYVRRMPEWRNGFLIARIHYGVDTLGGSITWGVAFHPVTSGTAFTGGFTITGFPAPAALNAIYTQSLASSALTTGYCQINYSNIGAILRIQRRPTHAADTNLGDVRIYGVEIVYTEGRRDTGVGFVENQKPLA